MEAIPGGIIKAPCDTVDMTATFSSSRRTVHDVKKPNQETGGTLSERMDDGGP